MGIPFQALSHTSLIVLVRPREHSKFYRKAKDLQPTTARQEALCVAIAFQVTQTFHTKANIL